MSSHLSATKTYHSETFQKECPKCASLNEISVTKQAGHNEPEEYSCAACSEPFGTVRASVSPFVKLLGKGD